jgi:nucleotide-binding universal stress UspA family protein
MVKRLVVPLDQSKFSESALPLARGLAAQLDLPLTLLSVIDAPGSLLRAQGGPREVVAAGSGNERPADPMMGSSPAYSGPAVSQKDLDKLAERVAQASQYLHRIAETFTDRSVEIEVVYGEPAERILSFAGTREDPAIVMASHGRSGISRMLLGSVAARVVQATRHPVFVVRGTGSSVSDGETRVEKLLVPLDQSNFASQALANVQRIFGPSGLDLVLLRVVETQRARGAYEHPASEEFVHSARQDAESYLEQKASELRARGNSVMCDLSEGRVAERINATAHTYDVDLIAMATHGSSADFRRLVLGSVAEQVLHEADKPLLLIRPSE